MSFGTPIAVERFGGLSTVDLRDPSEGAIDLMNVRVDLGDRIRVRPGYGKMLASAFGGIPNGIGNWDNGAAYVVISPTSVRMVDSTTWTSTDYTQSTTPAINIVGLTGSSFFGGFTTGPAAAMLLGRSTNAPAPILLAASLDHTLTSMRARFITGQSLEARTVFAYANSGAAAIPSRVYFSDAGFFIQTTSTSWVELTPNDGESITAATSFRELVLVFKESRFFVFYGNSTDAKGNSVFNYRTMDAGVGCNFPNGAVTARDGVYFLASDGLYRTRGDLPENVSGNMKAWFEGSPMAYLGLTPYNLITNASIHAGPDSIYIILDQKWVLVRDIASGEWTIYRYTNDAAIMLPLRRARSFVFADAAGKVYESNDLYVTDDTSGMPTSWYRFGFTDFGSPDTKVVRELQLDGIGKVNVSASSDWGDLGAAVAVTFDGDPVPAVGYYRKAHRGRLLSYEIAGFPGAGEWELDRMVYRLRDARVGR